MYRGEEEMLPVLVSNSEASEIRDKANFTYSTIAITAALLAAVTFSAYITPPSPPTFAVPANTTSVWDNREVAIQNAILETFYTIRTIIVPINFLMNLLSTLTACLVMVYVNSSRTSEEELVKMFGDPENEHDIIKVPVSLLFLGLVGTLLGLFVGIPIRYPQLANMVVLLLMLLLVVTLVLLAAFALCCASENSPVFDCLANCLQISPAFRKVGAASFILFFGSAKSGKKREDGQPKYWSGAGQTQAPGQQAGMYGGGSYQNPAVGGGVGGGYDAYGYQGGGAVHGSWVQQQQQQQGGGGGGANGKGGPQGGCCVVM